MIVKTISSEPTSWLDPYPDRSILSAPQSRHPASLHNQWNRVPAVRTDQAFVSTLVIQSHKYVHRCQIHPTTPHQSDIPRYRRRISRLNQTITSITDILDTRRRISRIKTKAQLLQQINKYVKYRKSSSTGISKSKTVLKITQATGRPLQTFIIMHKSHRDRVNDVLRLTKARQDSKQPRALMRTKKSLDSEAVVELTVWVSHHGRNVQLAVNASQIRKASFISFELLVAAWQSYLP